MDNINLDLLPLLVTFLPFFSAWLDSRKLQSDIPQKVINSVAESLELRERDITYLKQVKIEDDLYKNHLLSYIDYLWHWIRKHKPKRIKAPKVLEAFIMRNKR